MVNNHRPLSQCWVVPEAGIRLNFANTRVCSKKLAETHIWRAFAFVGLAQFRAGSR
jgi:hypothetical protein